MRASKACIAASQPVPRSEERQEPSTGRALRPAQPLTESHTGREGGEEKQ